MFRDLCGVLLISFGVSPSLNMSGIVLGLCVALMISVSCSGKIYLFK